MFIFTNKEDHVLFETASTAVLSDVGNYILDEGRLAIPSVIADIHELESIPDEVQTDISNYAITKWCYTEENGFVPNENYVEPPKSIEERLTEVMDYISELEDAICDLDANLE